MQSDMFSVQVRFTPRFEKDLKRLSRKYRKIKSDVSPLIKQLEENKSPGDRVPGTNFIVYKVRVKNSDLNKGKRAGYRVIYYVQKHDVVMLLTIYAKSDQPDIKPHQIEHIIQDIVR